MNTTDDIEWGFPEWVATLKNSALKENEYPTFGLIFEEGISHEGRENLTTQSISEIRSGVRGISDNLLKNQNTFYVIGVFLKFLSELGFSIQETLDEVSDFEGDMDLGNLQIYVEFNYGGDFVEYSCKFSDLREDRENSDKGLLASILGASWDLPLFEGELKTSNLYCGLESFVYNFRNSWTRYQEIASEFKSCSEGEKD